MRRYHSLPVCPVSCGILVLVAMTSFAAGEQQDGSTALKSGLVWVWFHDIDFTRPAEMGVDPAVRHDTGQTIQGYSRWWRGFLKAPCDGEVRFTAEADDGLRMWIGEKLVIDGWGPDQPRQGRLTAKAGELLPIEIRFYQNGGAAFLRLFWEWEGKAREAIPASAFFHGEADERAARELKEGKAQVEPRIEDCSSLYRPSVGNRRADAPPVRLGVGPHLWIDDDLIDSCRGFERKVHTPQRQLSEPVVTGKKGKGDDCFQPYVTVLHDPATKRFRMYYGVPDSEIRSHLAMMESDDGIHWIRPYRRLPDPSPIQFGVSIFDEGPNYPDPSRRYKYGYYGRDVEGLRVACSADGLEFKPLVPHIVFRHNHDINNIYRDEVRNRYMGIFSIYIRGSKWSGLRRVTSQAISDDLIHWSPSWLVVTPEDRVEAGETQFYAMCGFLQRGPTLIGMVKVLHDDYAADPGGAKAGVGWTSLAWTRDGRHWTRDPEVYFDRHPASGQWDHAMAWIDEQLPVNNEVYLYYGGYARGHKINRFEERQIGLLRIKRDRYVARQAGADGGSLRTPPVVIEGDTVTLNVDASNGGEVRVQLLDEKGNVIPGFAFDDCRTIGEDAVEAPVQWKGQASAIRNKPVRIDIMARQARLFALNVK